MKLDLIKKAVLSLFLVLLLTPFLIKAITIDNPLDATTFEELIDKIINFIFYIAVAIFPIMVIVAGFFYLSSGGDPAKTRTARNILLYSIIGLFIVLFAKGLISVIKQLMGGS